MHHAISDRKSEVAAACRQYGVRRLRVFGSGARGADFDVARSDADLLIEFECWNGRDPYPGLKAELEKVLERRVDLYDREAMEESRNYLRQAAILQDAEIVYEAPRGEIRAELPIVIAWPS